MFFAFKKQKLKTGLSNYVDKYGGIGGQVGQS